MSFTPPSSSKNITRAHCTGPVSPDKTMSGESQRKWTKRKKLSGEKALREWHTDRPSREHPHLVTG